jgi:hypothetical protein
MRKLALLVAMAGMVFAGTAAEATTADLQAAAMAEASQTYHWRFEGADASTAGLDYEVSANNLLEHNVGATHPPTHITYDAPGFDATSTAASTWRTIPGTDFGHGDGFVTSAAITPGATFSWEVLLQTGSDPVPIQGGTWNQGYVLSDRSGGPRGYFLWQGTSTSNSGDGFTSLTGDWIAGEATVVPGPLPADNWYYMAGTYTVNPGDGSSQVDLYYADLTAGDTSLTHTAFANPKAYDYGVPGAFGVGKRFDGTGEAFPGVLDEVYLYESALTQQTLQSHLDALLRGGEQVVLPEPATLALVGLGMIGLVIRRK